jgi:hypothetical protein
MSRKPPSSDLHDRALRVSLLQHKMEAAAQALEFEEARRLRDEISLLRGGASIETACLSDTSGLERQTPGRMGLGTNQSRPTPPAGWKAPPKPDLMTSKRGRPR